MNYDVCILLQLVVDQIEYNVMLGAFIRKYEVAKDTKSKLWRIGDRCNVNL